MTKTRSTRRAARRRTQMLVPPVTPVPPPSDRSIDLPRVGAVDAARGFAVAMMIAYHFCFDLTYYGWADWAMLTDGRWIAWRSAIVASFLFVVGLSLALRDERERGRAHGRARGRERERGPDRSFAARWSQIAIAAALVTAGSAVLFPRSFIYFGVLHFVAVAIVLCRRAPRLGGWAVALGGAVIALGIGWTDAAFNPRSLNWIGFVTEKPQTEDYVPLFPWLGVVLLGCGAGSILTRARDRVSPALQVVRDALPRALCRPFATMGRWSLTIYLVHQPLMLGALGLIAASR